MKYGEENDEKKIEERNIENIENNEKKKYQRRRKKI